MDKIWVKKEERSAKLLFLALIAIIFTLLASSHNLFGNSLYYLIFLASSLFYYVIISKDRTNGYCLFLSAVFISISYVLYLSDLFSGMALTEFFNLKVPLYLIIGVSLVMGLLPENVKSEIEEKFNS
ncbi:MAG: hypothetical protein ACI977_000320 [Candidatus Nanohaloarchaea archaeon]|jgi:hypothetical protein